jgi:hypothetical protein
MLPCNGGRRVGATRASRRLIPGVMQLQERRAACHGMLHFYGIPEVTRLGRVQMKGRSGHLAFSGQCKILRAE